MTQSSIVATSIVLLGLLPLVAPAAETLTGELTNISGTEQRLISYRNQEHMWVTADGRRHVIVNVGGSGGALRLYSNSGQGTTWQQQLSVSDSFRVSTSDGLLIGDTLHVVYSSSAHEIRYRRYKYAPATRTWSQVKSALVQAASSTTYSGVPTLAIDGKNRLWCSSTTFTLAGADFQTRIAYSADDGTTWRDSTVRFGTPNGVVAKGARLVTLDRRVGILYTDASRSSLAPPVLSLHFAYRWDSAATNVAWQPPVQLFMHQGSTLDDPYGTHVSAVVDSYGDLHVASQDQGQLIYLRYNTAARTWSSPEALSEDVNVHYMQLSEASNGDLWLVYNSGAAIQVMVSHNGGRTFLDHARLEVPESAGLDIPFPRVETAGHSGDEFLVLQQVEQSFGASQGLVSFVVR